MLGTDPTSSSCTRAEIFPLTSRWDGPEPPRPCAPSSSSGWVGGTSVLLLPTCAGNSRLVQSRGFGYRHALAARTARCRDGDTERVALGRGPCFFPGGSSGSQRGRAGGLRSPSHASPGRRCQQRGGSLPRFYRLCQVKTVRLLASIDEIFHRASKDRLCPWWHQ